MSLNPTGSGHAVTGGNPPVTPEEKDPAEGKIETDNGTKSAKTLTEQEKAKARDNKSSCCDPKAGLKWTAIAVAIIGFVAGAVGLLNYMGMLQLSLTGVGAMSTATGMYVMLGGFGVTVITTLLLGIARCLKQGDAASKEGKKPWCASFCGSKVKKKEALGV